MENDMGDFMDFYNRQRSPIYDGRGNVIGYNHGYGEREDFDKPIPRSEYKGQDMIWVRVEDLEEI